MLLRRISVENVRSFRDRQTLMVDGRISIIVGPNGGGKTNLLDSIVSMLRRHLFATAYARQAPQQHDPDYWQVYSNDHLMSLALDKHSSALGAPQIIEVDIEVSQSDIDNMAAIARDRVDRAVPKRRNYNPNPWEATAEWSVDDFVAGRKITYTLTNNTLTHDGTRQGAQFLAYLHLVEMDNALRAELQKSPLSLPMIYLPITRAANGFQSSVSLANHDDFETKRQVDSTSSRSGGNIVQLAVGRIASMYNDFLHQDNQSVNQAFYNEENVKRLTRDLKALGYDWELAVVDRAKNVYDIRLQKQGSSFLVGAASSGEKELLTYLFAIHALNVRDAVIVVDEPELHLHPRWQKALFDLFERLSNETGNQFIVATHSPTFISPSSIQYVSRVYSVDQESKILRLNSSSLPDAKHILNIVNSQNNEVIFFSERVVLVEGVSDRLVFEKLSKLRQSGQGAASAPEFIGVGGKNLFPAYSKMLSAFEVPSQIIADLDYVQEVGSGEVKAMLTLNAKNIKKDVIDNVKSIDADALVDRIDEALASGDWGDAKDVWDYIKSKRTSLRRDLDDEEKAILHTFIDEQKANGTLILKEGAIESYLPTGLRGKNIDALISFLEEPDFLSQMPACKAELLGIIDALMVAEAVALPQEALASARATEKPEAP